MKKQVLIAAVLVNFGVAIASGQPIIYVDDSATGADNGSSWCDAYVHLQDALAAAAVSAGLVNEIRVAQGTHKPDQGAGTVAGDRTATLQLLDGVTINGGYAGCGEADPDARDVNLYTSVLSGDLNGDDGPDFANNDDNSYHVVTASGTDATAVLDGFHITSGNANGTLGQPSAYGGGVYNLDGTPILRRCTIAENSGGVSSGAGMYNGSNANAVLTSCSFIGNVVLSGGGAILNEGNLTATECSFTYNHSSDGAAGIFNEGTVVLADCAFERNGANEDTGGLANLGTATLTRCTFIGNWGNEDNGHAGGVANYGTADITACVFLDNWHVGNGGIANGGDLTLTNTVFSGNLSLGPYGGGGAIGSSGDGTVSIVNSTFFGNIATGALGGGVYLGGTNSSLVNSILWGNTGGGTTTESNQIALAGGGTVSVSYTCIEGLATLTGNNNFGTDPLFVNADGADNTVGTEDDNLRLLPSSPCIDAGNNLAVPPDIHDLDHDADTTEPIPFDLDRDTRFVDDAATLDTGNGAAPIVDMGAYEFQVDNPIPTVSEWGLLVLVQTGLIAGTIVFSGRHRNLA